MKRRIRKGEVVVDQDLEHETTTRKRKKEEAGVEKELETGARVGRGPDLRVKDLIQDLEKEREGVGVDRDQGKGRKKGVGAKKGPEAVLGAGPGRGLQKESKILSQDLGQENEIGKTIAPQPEGGQVL